MGKPGYLGSFLRLGGFWYVRQGTGAILIEIPMVSGGGYVLGFGHRHRNRFEVVRWVGDKGRRLQLLGKSTRLACRFLGDVIVRYIGVFKIRLAPTRGRVVRGTEGKLGGRER